MTWTVPLLLRETRTGQPRQRDARSHATLQRDTCHEWCLQSEDVFNVPRAGQVHTRTYREQTLRSLKEP